MHLFVNIISVLVFLAGSDGIAYAATLPATEEVELSSTTTLSELSDLEPCHINHIDKDECIKGLFHTIAPRLDVGIPEFNMVSIDPYFYKKGIFRFANEGGQGGLLIKNMNVHGISTINVADIRINFTDFGLLARINASIPKLQADGNFKADFKFGGLRLVPKGPFNITIENIRTIIVTSGAIEPTDDGPRLKLNRLNASVAIGNTKLSANGIFTDKNLNMMIMNLVNENLPEIARIGIPATRDQWAPILVQHINSFFANVPIDKFLVQ